jgi:hypothetical protein
MSRENELLRHGRSLWRLATPYLATALLVACDLGVTNPGRIEDEALNNATAMGPLVTGMAGDFATIYDNMAYFMGIASGEITHSGAFETEQFLARGEIEPRHVNGMWGQMHRARWVAEQGLARMQTVLGDAFTSSALAAEANLWAGFANRMLGENVCVSVFDGGPPGDVLDYFRRAETNFTDAMAMAQAAGSTAATLRTAAYGGRAQVRAALGDWAGAATDAQQVASTFRYQAIYSAANSREYNWLYNESFARNYFSVYGTFAASLNNTDPRMPFLNLNKNGADGKTPAYQQRKYLSYSAAIDIAAGDEMRLIEAEKLLRVDADVSGAMGLINGVRTAAGVPTKTASTVAEAMAVLRTERDIVLWLETRHLWDLQRFDDPFLSGRDRCIPPSENEQNTNPNLQGS